MAKVNIKSGTDTPFLEYLVCRFHIKCKGNIFFDYAAHPHEIL